MKAEPPTTTQTTIGEKIRGWIFVFCMLMSAFLGTIYILMPLMPLLFVRPRLYRKMVDRFVGFWLVLPSVSPPDLSDMCLGFDGVHLRVQGLGDRSFGGEGEARLDHYEPQN